MIIQGKLEAEGIPSYDLDSFLGTSNSSLLTGLKSIRVQVDQALTYQAIEVIQALQHGEYALDNDDIGIWAVIFLVRIPVGAAANIVYFKKAEMAAHEAQAAQLLNEQGIQRLKQQGGFSMLSALMGLGIFFLLRISLSMI